MCSLPSNSLWSREGVRGVENGKDRNTRAPDCGSVKTLNQTAMGS